MKGTLLGFTWNNIHSSALGLIRTSDGSEFSNELLPSFEDRTTDRPGSDGTFYYGTHYEKRTINMQVAFNDLTDAQLRSIKILFGEKMINNLVLDEEPFKMYKVRLASMPSINYNVFTNDYTYVNGFQIPHNHNLSSSYLPQAKANDRVYKGTMDLEFVAYEPYAITRTAIDPQTSITTKLKYSDQFNNVAYVPEWKLDPTSSSTASSNIDWNIYNYDEWKDSILLKASTDTVTYASTTYTIDTPLASGVAVYNPGDVETPWNLTFNFGAVSKGIQTSLVISSTQTGSSNTQSMTFTNFTLADDEVGFRINGKLQLIEGINANGETTGRLYNRYITGGHFFNIEPTNGAFKRIVFTFGAQATMPTMTIDYDYRYF